MIGSLVDHNHHKVYTLDHQDEDTLAKLSNFAGSLLPECTLQRSDTCSVANIRTCSTKI